MSAGIVVGAGPGIGASVALRLARENLAVGMIARSEATIAAARSALADHDSLGLTADVTDEAQLRSALDEIVDRFGVPEILVYNVALIRRDEIGELSARQHLDAWAINVGGAITAIAHVAPRMARGGRGTILITGGMPEPLPEFTSLSLGKAGVRALTDLVARRFGPDGLHVATVTLGGAVAHDSPLSPDDVADEYWRLHNQPPTLWEREVLYAGRPQSRAPGGAREGQVRVLLVSGSGRAGSVSTAVLATAAASAPDWVTTTWLEKIGDLPLFNPDDDREGRAVDHRVEAMRRSVAEADAILFCTPEYAGALPATLKNALEWTVGDAGTYQQPVAWINAAGPASPTGARDAHESLAKVLGYVGAEVVDDACLRVPVTRTMVGPDGLISDPGCRAQILTAVRRLATRASQRSGAPA